MKHINHNPETEGEPLPEAMKAAIEALVVNLQANRVRDCLFVIAAFRGGVPNPMETVQIASNMTPELTNRFLSILGKGGTIVIIGSRGTVEVNPRDVMRTEGSIVGVLGTKPKELAEAHAAIGAGLRTGTLRPIVGKEIPLGEAPRAHKEIIEGTAYGKIVLVP